jgi:hypothetical protein
LSFQDAIKVDFDRIQSNATIDVSTLQETYYASCEVTNGRGPYRTYLDSGYYYNQIERYRYFFPDNQIKIVCFSDLRSDPFAFIQDLQRFVGVDYYNDKNFEVIHENPALEQSMTRPPIEPEVKRWLVNHYGEHNQKLEKLIGRDLSSWNKV